jgi:GPH family glycoside/pentoside/hexuronide:cation symporter
MSGLYAVLWLLLMSIMLLRVRERPEFAGRAPNPLVPGVRRSLRNRPFRILLLAGVVNAIPAAIPAILLPYFVEYVLQPENPGRWVGLFLLLYLGTGLLFVPLWMAVARRVGKLATMITASAVAITGSVFYFFAGPGDLVFVSGIFFVTGTAAMAGTFLIPAMAADVIDYDELRTGKRREAQFTALWAIIPKFVAIPGSSIPLAVMAAVGYVPNQVQTAEVQITIRFLYSVFPAVFYVAALAILSRYPVSESIHNRVRDGIAARARGETAIDPLTQERLVPAEHTDVDEDTGWFLDHFSPRELARGLADGMHKVTTSVLRAAGLSLAACVASCVVAANTLGALDAKPGLTSVLAVVAAGFSFTLFVFHTVRLRPAHRLTSGSVDAGTISAHLRSLAGNDGE